MDRRKWAFPLVGVARASRPAEFESPSPG
jgi:hypothetical protein